MKKHTIAAYAFWILLAEGAGGAAGWLTREGVRLYTETILKPPLSPPPIVFPVVWTILYALMGVSAARIALAPGVQDRARALWIFGLQLALNVSWSLIFFNLQWFGFAALWLAGLWGGCPLDDRRLPADRKDRRMAPASVSCLGQLCGISERRRLASQLNHRCAVSFRRGLSRSGRDGIFFVSASKNHVLDRPAFC